MKCSIWSCAPRTCWFSQDTWNKQVYGLETRPFCQFFFRQNSAARASHGTTLHSMFLSCNYFISTTAPARLASEATTAHPKGWWLPLRTPCLWHFRASAADSEWYSADSELFSAHQRQQPFDRQSVAGVTPGHKGPSSFFLSYAWSPRWKAFLWKGSLLQVANAMAGRESTCNFDSVHLPCSLQDIPRFVGPIAVSSRCV